MGQFLSRFLYTNEHIQQIFTIMYMSSRGPTEFNMELTPVISADDSPEMVNQKFRNALKKQNELKKTYKLPETLEKRIPQSKKLASGFFGYFSSANAIPNAFRESLCKRKKSVNQTSQISDLTQNRGQQDFNFPNQELRERRARSRPEPSVMHVPNSQRQAKSMSMHTNLSPIEENPFESVEVEMIDVDTDTNKNFTFIDTKKSASDSKEIRPTTYFMASFKSASPAAYHEAEYSFDRAKGIDSFKFTGSLESLLSGDAKLSYQRDKKNNNLDEQAIFFKNLPELINSLEGHLLINGYMLPLNKNEDRFKLISLKLDPPSLSFDMNGLKHIKASQNCAELYLSGCAVDDVIVKSLSIKGKSEQDAKELQIQQHHETMVLNVQFPLLSRIPVSNKK